MTLEHLLKLYYKKYPEQKKFSMQEIEEFDTSEPQETSKFLSLYKLRNENYKSKKGIDNLKFKNLIESLEVSKEPSVIMHILKINNTAHTIITNTSFTEVIAEL